VFAGTAVPSEPPVTTAQVETVAFSTVTWADVLPGVWRARTQGYLGEELWSFNRRLGTANWQFWPRGFGVTNPLDNGVAAPNNIGKLYRVSGRTLTVSSVLSTRVYRNLRSDNRNCFSADFEGRRVQFCRLL
jgi:hypothetical protein